MSQFEREKGAYKISTDPRCIDLEAAHKYLSHSYWAEEIPKETLARGFASSLCFALLGGSRQINLKSASTASIAINSGPPVNPLRCESEESIAAAYVRHFNAN